MPVSTSALIPSRSIIATLSLTDYGVSRYSYCDIGGPCVSLCLSPRCCCRQRAFRRPDCGGHGNRDGMLVSTKWLSEHLHDSGHRGACRRSEGRVRPGPHPRRAIPRLQRNRTEARRPTVPTTCELPPMADLARVFSEFGVSNTSRIILYVSKDYDLTDDARLSHAGCNGPRRSRIRARRRTSRVAGRGSCRSRPRSRAAKAGQAGTVRAE